MSAEVASSAAPPHVLTASLKVLWHLEEKRRDLIVQEGWCGSLFVRRLTPAPSPGDLATLLGESPKAGPGEVTPLEEKRRDLIVQEGWHGSLFVRCPTAAPSPGDLATLLGECEGKKSGAVYVALPEPLMADHGQQWLSIVLGLGYKHHHFHRETGEQIYYKWDIPDMVPEYATAIEGGGVLVVSQDEKEVLLVRNRGWTDSHWARPGGAVNAGESCLEAALRECQEETQVALDETFDSWSATT